VSLKDKKFYFVKGYEAGERHELKRIIKLIKDTYANPEHEEASSFVFTEDIVDLIKGEQK